MKEMAGIVLAVLVSFLFALASAWGAVSAAWWSFPVFLFGALLSVACACYAGVLVICATSGRRRNG